VEGWLMGKINLGGAIIFEWPRAGLNQVARKGVRPWPREGRRRL